MRRVGGVILAILLAVGVIAAVAVGTNGFGLVNQTVAVSGVIGSEKEPFFADQRVREIFADKGYEVTIETAGSRQIATEALDEPGATYDFAFPSSAPAAARISADREVIGTYRPFYSPMVIASFAPIVELLQTAGVVTEAGGVYSFDMAAYLALIEADTRWTALEGNEGGSVYPADREILITSTDVRRSNSAAMYLSLVSYVENEGRVVTTSAEEAAVLPVLRRIFLDQGFSASSSEGPFVDYLTLGLGKAPLVLAYESQYLDRQIRNDGSITADMVLMYPSPTVLSQHTLLSLTDNGDAVGQLLDTDPGLQRLLAEYGFRIRDRAVFSEVLEGKEVAVPPDIVDTVDTPSYEVLERLIVSLEALYTEAGAAPIDPNDTETGDAADSPSP